jgi:hypothetical protein
MKDGAKGRVRKVTDLRTGDSWPPNDVQEIGSAAAARVMEEGGDEDEMARAAVEAMEAEIESRHLLGGGF